VAEQGIEPLIGQLERLQGIDMGFAWIFLGMESFQIFSRGFPTDGPAAVINVKLGT